MLKSNFIADRKMTERLISLRTASGQKGAAAIEFVIVLPLLLLIFTGMIEYGRMMWHYDALAKATRDAARYLSTVKRTDLNTEDTTATSTTHKIVIDAAAAAGLSTTGLQINPSCDPTCTGEGTVNTVSVDIDYPFTIGGWVPVFGAAIGPDVTLSPHTTMPYMWKAPS
jgi:Flp pilus assembly protein TadG